MSTFQNEGAAYEPNMEGENVYRMFYMFLNEFQAYDDDKKLVYIYRNERASMINQKKTTLLVDFRHLYDKHSELMEAINLEYYK